MSPIISKLYHDGYINEARGVGQREIFKAAIDFTKEEGILPAPESAHAIKVAIDEAIKCRETKEDKTILIGLSGHGDFDLISYKRYLESDMENYIPTKEDLEKGFSTIPNIKALV